MGITAQQQHGIQEVLRMLGIGRQYLGYGLTMKAVRMALEDESCLFCIKQGIFVPLAEQMHCDWRTVERNIRTVIHRAWCVDRERVMNMAGFPLRQAPTVTEFIDIISGYIQREQMAARGVLRR